MYVRIQTNRAKLKQIIASFQSNAVENEKLIAPRPLPKENFKFYVGFAFVIEGSRNEQMVKRLKNHKIISQLEFESEIESIKYFWVARNNLT